MPALPIGPRSRLAAEALAGLTAVLLARLLAFLAGVYLHLRGGSLQWLSSAMIPFASPDARLTEASPYQSLGALFVLVASASAQVTWLGTLVVLPLLLVWASVPRFDGPCFLKPAVVSCLMFAGLQVGVMRSSLPAAVVSFGLSALVLALVGIEPRFERSRPADLRPAALFRRAPGPEAQFGRDQWLGPLRALWLPFTVIAVVSGLAIAQGAVTLAQGALVALFVVGPPAALLFPLGIALVSGREALSSPPFTGYFRDGWATLPVRPEAVARAVYAHGWVAEGLVLALLFADTWLGMRAGLWGRGPFALVRMQIPILILGPSLMVCVAVGDRWRGLWALGSLLLFVLGCPLSLLAIDLLGASPLPRGLTNGDAWVRVGLGLALVGALPALVHLRGRRRSGSASTVAH